MTALSIVAVAISVTGAAYIWYLAWWQKKYAAPKPADCQVLRETLAAVPAKRLVVGHTVHKEGVLSACDGAVWCIDVGMAAYYGGHPEAIEIVGEQVRVLRQ